MKASALHAVLVHSLACLLALPLLGGLALAAKPAPPLGLAQAVQKALAYSPNLQATKEDLDAARELRQEMRTNFMPFLSTNYSYKGTQEAPTSRTALGVFQTGSANTYQWSTSLSQPIFTGFNLTSTYRLADLGVDVAQVQVRLTALDLVLGVKEAYFEYLRAQKAEEVASQAVKQLTSHLQTAKDFFDVGIIPINDVLKAEVELANAQQQEVAAQNATSVARAKLNTLLGLAVDGALEVEDILAYHQVDIAYDEARNLARRQRPELASLDLKLLQADQTIRQAQSRYYPQVNLVGSYIQTSDRPELGDNDYYDPTNWQVVTQLDWTFWEWGRTGHQVSQRRAQKRRLERTRRDVRDQVDLQVKQTYLGLHDVEKNIVTAKASIRSATENFRITEERFREQLATNTDVLDAQTLLTQAQNNYYSALTLYNVAEARLRRAMGDGVPDGVVFPPEAEPVQRPELAPLSRALGGQPPAQR